MLGEIYAAAARAALADGITDPEIGTDGSGTYPLVTWIRSHVRYRPETEWFVMFGIACALADIINPR